MILIKEHNDKCRIKDTKSEFYLIKDTYWGDKNGQDRGRTNRWHNILCNDPECSFRAVICDQDIGNLVKRNL